MARSDEIRAAALALFMRLGYEATTMADIGKALGIRGPSLYKHVRSKQELLAGIMTGTMEDLLAQHRAAVATTGDPVERLRRATETHVRYHARHRSEAFVGTREIRSLVEPHREVVLALRAEYEAGFRELVQAGVTAGCFDVASVRLASYAILDLGMGVAVWYRDDGELSEDIVVWQHSEFALRLVGVVRDPGTAAVTRRDRSR
ncbi:TetR/AcrR family transcriptional regulator [Amycolatopsis acidiphila]|uniref:TetR/AcrR family transcriptional regulator n=1 Tax=Amycolatopsis acidiphila TaxID=715473 RepID=A0A558AB26_9PSEU|nr:TetR/AcrR family transcriptional regulator [Amycolatopsis acidiphila]TVT21466.1 TetR/AcrR family transcriptional regulator [Amycolatopsis acidiphila]UIJ63144.1 TetR/AcrR family transcriptional regulator [Amycolatopsis acidiphila]GHG73993.1 TetR family transcriptional regulator [Amycolatopsis acidiphila]